MSLRSLYIYPLRTSFIAPFGLCLVLFAGCNTEDNVSPNKSNAENIDTQDVLEADADTNNEGDSEDGAGSNDDVDNGRSSITLTAMTVTPGEANPSDKVAVAWLSRGADKCVPVGNTPGWADQELGLEGPFEFEIPWGSEPGTYQIGVECTAGSASELKVATLKVLEPKPEIINFTITPDSVTQGIGENITVKWSAEYADNCKASGTFADWSGTKDTSGSASFEPGNSLEPQTYNLILTCENRYGHRDTKSASFELKDKCEGRTITTLERDLKPSVNYNGTSWKDIFLYWPGTAHLTPIRIKRDHYAAIKFTAESPLLPHASISVGMNGASYRHGPAGSLLVTFSTCPGDFNKEAIDADPDLDGSCFNTRRMAYQEEPLVKRCLVQENKTYYLNMVPINFADETPENNNDVIWYCKDDDQASNCGLDIVLTKTANGWPDN